MSPTASQTASKTAPQNAPLRDVPLLPSELTLNKRADGTVLVKSALPLGPYPTKTTDWLDEWAAKDPDRVYIAQRDGTGPWNTLSYSQVRNAARSIATALLARKLSDQRPIAMLSGNDLGQCLLGFAAQYIGVPFAPVSPAYSLMSQDFGKLRYVLGVLNPGLIYVTSGKQFAKALEAVVPADVEIVYAVDPPPGRTRSTPVTELIATPATSAVDTASAAVTPDTIVKFLFTSGSTGNPKAVINTQRMLTADIVMVAAGMPFVEKTPPVLVDWLPWSHTFAGNHNINFVLRHGGTLYLDDGKPMPGAIEQTVANLRDIAPTIYFNVPRGFETLLPYLKSDAALRKNFFSRLQAMFYAGASLPQHVWDGLQEAAVAETGHQIRFITGLGSTETAPGCIASTNKCTRSGMVGLPLPGVELKLVPNSGKLEARVRGPNVTPGYWKQPELTKEAFDEEGFYKLGDALKFVDEKDTSLGLLFDGRVAEDFKLTTGTWVSVGPLRADGHPSHDPAGSRRRHHRPRPRFHRRAADPRPRVLPQGVRPAGYRVRRSGLRRARGAGRYQGPSEIARLGTEGLIDESGARRRPDHTVVARRRRDHGQGFGQPARRDRGPGRARGAAIRRQFRLAHRRCLNWPERHLRNTCAMPRFTNRMPVRISWGDCDPAQIVYYPRYFAMFDTAVHELFRAALGMPKKEWTKQHGLIGFPMVDTRARFIMPTSYGDDIVIESQVTEFRKSSFDLVHKLTKDGTLAVEGFETRVLVGPEPGRPGGIGARAIPQAFIDAFEKAN